MFRKILRQEVNGLSIAHWENLAHHLFLLKVLLTTCFIYICFIYMLFVAASKIKTGRTE